MAEESVDLRKEVFNKLQYEKTINTSFNEFGVLTINEELETQPTVEEFFGLYNSLFYDIPALGNTNSHQYLVRTSGEYINFDEISEEISALQAEIAQLRGDLLKAQMMNIRTQAASSENEESNNTLAELESELINSNQALIDAASNASQDAATSTNIDITIPGGSLSEGDAVTENSNDGG